MGLFRKAAVSVPRGGTTPPLVFAPEPELPSQDSPGLLRRGLELRDVPATAPGPEPSELPPVAKPVLREAAQPQVRHLAEITSEIVSAIEALPDGVELPSRLFSIVSAKLGVRKGALLLYDALRLVYAPWASTGFDQTTMHRLRIPLGANESFNALANGDPLILNDVEGYQEYFSSREFSALARVLFAPFIASERLVGMLLLTDIAGAAEPDADMLECLREIVRAGSPRVDAARAKKLSAAGAAAVQAPVSLEEQALTFLGPRGQSPALFLSLSVEDYAQRILAGHEHLDPFRLHEDLHYFLGAFVADTGAAFAVRPGRFIVALRSIDVSDMDIFLHQLTLHLDGLFGGPERREKEARPRILKTRAWPSNGDDVRALLDDLAS
jgi:hypothetical protein